jgi:hypothetical protein
MWAVRQSARLHLIYLIESGGAEPVRRAAMRLGASAQAVCCRPGERRGVDV